MVQIEVYFYGGGKRLLELDQEQWEALCEAWGWYSQRGTPLGITWNEPDGAARMLNFATIGLIEQISS